MIATDLSDAITKTDALATALNELAQAGPPSSQIVKDALAKVQTASAASVAAIAKLKATP